jgi:hypothetical protein
LLIYVFQKKIVPLKDDFFNILSLSRQIKKKPTIFYLLFPPTTITISPFGGLFV